MSNDNPVSPATLLRQSLKVYSLFCNIHIENLLSFGSEGVTLELRPLNVLIGPNGCGKSNLLEAIRFFQAAPTLLVRPIRDSGGIHDWIHFASTKPVARLEATVNTAATILKHSLSFAENDQRFELVEESIRGETSTHYRYSDKSASAILESKRIKKADLDREQSILSQRKDPDRYQALWLLEQAYEQIRVYRDWTFGPQSVVRNPQKPDLRQDLLDEGFANLGVVLGRIRRNVRAKTQFKELLRQLIPDIDDFSLSVEGGKVQVFLEEGRHSIPAGRLSDGTMRYLCLLAILLEPQPPPLICIDEPELGMHPDIIVSIGELLKQASERTQIIVTTHSKVLVDCFTDSPEDVVVCEKVDGQSTMKRLSKEELAPWLEKYSLGELWRTGEIGGNRW